MVISAGGGDEGLRDGWERKHTSGKTTSEGKDALNEGPKHEGLLPAVEICETAEEEEKTTRAKSKGRDEPLQLVGGDPKVLADGWKSDGCGCVCRSLCVLVWVSCLACGTYRQRTD